MLSLTLYNLILLIHPQLIRLEIRLSLTLTLNEELVDTVIEGPYSSKTVKKRNNVIAFKGLSVIQNCKLSDDSGLEDVKMNKSLVTI